MKLQLKIGFILAGCLIFGNLCLEAQSTSDSKGWVKNKGIQYNIAEDRKFEQLGGSFTEPEGLDKYMKRKFDALDQKIKVLDERLIKMSEQLQKIQDKMK